MSTPISLSNLLPIPSPNLYKLHLAGWNGYTQPLDDYVRSRADWDTWNSWRGNRNDYNRDYIFSLMDFYPQQHHWLFGGVYRVISRNPQNNSHSYKVVPVPQYEPYVGRLKVIFKRPGRGRVYNLESYYPQFTVAEILPQPYTGEPFSGYDSTHLSFAQLENLVNNQRLDWKTALGNVKGVYLITDNHNGKRYVGSAYGVTGIWSRWQTYVISGHGYNDELTRLIAKEGLTYARSHFSFTLLENYPMRSSDDFIIARECYWKLVLLTRNPDFGYNKN